MGTLLSFVLAFIISLFAGNAAAHALALHFRVEEEFIAVLLALLLAALVSIIVFALVYLFARHPRVFNYVAWLLVLVTVVLVAVPGVSDWMKGRAASPVPLDAKNIQAMLELLVPSWIMILIQWGWVRRRWGRTGPPGAREMAMTRWPWMVTVIALILVLSPPALEVIEKALRQSVTDWFRSIWLGVTLGGTALILILAWVEYTIRARRIERASRAVPPVRPQRRNQNGARGWGRRERRYLLQLREHNPREREEWQCHTEHRPLWLHSL